jgi:hypothetical protein
VCPPALSPWGWRLPTRRTLARWPGWVHIPYCRAAAHQHGLPAGLPALSGVGPPSTPPAPYQHVPVHVSTSYRSRPSPQEPGQVHSQVRDTCHRPPLRSWAEGVRGTSSKGSFGGNLRRELRQASTPVDGADRGNQPIHRRVDTISKQYQARQHPQGGTQDDSDYGGGAPWES